MPNYPIPLIDPNNPPAGTIGGLRLVPPPNVPQPLSPDVVANIQQADPSPKPLSQQIKDSLQTQSQMQALPAPTIANIASMGGAQTPALSQPAMPDVEPSQTLTDINNRNYLHNSGPAASQIGQNVDPQTGIKTPMTGQPWWKTALRDVGKVGATIGDTALSVVAPGAAMFIPGTTMHNRLLQAQAQGAVNNDLSTQEQEATIKNLDLQPQLRLMTAQNAALHTQYYGQHIDDQGEHYGNQDATHQAQAVASAAEHGMKPDGKGGWTPMSYSELSPTLQSMEDYKAAQTEYQQAQAALKSAQNDPTSPVYRLAKQRADTALQNANTALQRLSLAGQNQHARLYGTDMQGNALPGAMLADDGTPIGSMFQGNVRPTGTERNKGDMANSAAEQISTMKSIIQKHPTLFGPGYGQNSSFKQWLGSEDPDAQRFLAARTIAADHLAGTFGGRSEYALTALDNAAGQFKDNPQAALAGLDQLAGANARFQKAGTVRTAHGQGGPTTAGNITATAPPRGATMKVPGSDGKLHWSDGKQDLGLAQ